VILKNAEQINIKLTNKTLKKLIKINNSSLIIIYSLITQFQKLKFPIIDAMVSKFGLASFDCLHFDRLQFDRLTI
jgi:hypothetical protein